MKISVIISTYNNPEWLEKVLWGYEQQSYDDFEVLIADDGSGDDTKLLITRFQKESTLTIKHAWHPDNGFQKCQILNLATTLADGEYLIFTDGDCIPHPHFIAIHAQNAEPGYLLSGGYCKLPMALSKKISHSEIRSKEAFRISWLRNNGLRSFSSMLKLGLSSPWSKLADLLTTTKPTWNGCNASTWKTDIIKVNGHNELMKYGGEDREMGERLLNMGHKAKQLRHQAILIHLDHARGYISQEDLAKNLEIREQTAREKAVWTAHGILKQSKP